MASLTSNLVKRVERLPKPTRTSEAMLPLFEAISNSIHSTQKKYGDKVASQGRIVVTVDSGRKKKAQIKIVVEDNGTGLDDHNYRAFTETDTDNKIDIGGKGVGRLLWLDCFEKVHVESIFIERGKTRSRKFDFRLSLVEQIQNMKENEVDPPPQSVGVTITFEGLRDNGYRARFPGRASYIFQHLSSHFLPTFIGKNCPRISVYCGDDTKEYPDAIDSLIHRRTNIDDIKTDDYGLLSLTLMECDKVASADLPGSHFVHFIAHDRTVRSQKIDGKLGLKYFGTNADRVFHACLFGQYLNKNVNQERTAFTFDDSVVERLVNTVCMPSIDVFLQYPLQELRSAQGEIVANIASSYPSVAFGSIDELQGHIPTGELNDDAIYGHLSRERFRRDQKQAQQIRSVLARLKEGNVDENVFSSVLAEAGKAIEEAEQKSLAEYVVRRKVVLDFLEVLIQKVRDDVRDSSYQREDILHSFICPVRIKTVGKEGSKQAAPASHDLWVIDERLTFAQYFSSDVAFSELSATMASDERPDVLIFDRVHGLRQTDQSSKVLLVEFKRPGRTNYDNDENPHQQVERYVRRLLSGGQIDVKGRPIVLHPDTVFHCFVIADIVGKMDEWTYSWPRTADGRGRFYQPGHGFKGTVELIGWDRLLEDARERNQAFFDRAGISGKSFFSDS